MARLRTTLRYARLILWYAGFGAAKRVVPLRRLLRFVQQPRRRVARPDATVRAGEIVRVSRLFGAGDRDCLQRSLLLFRELTAAGEAPVLYVGFRKAASGLEGHVWVTCDGRLIADSLEDVDRFAVAMRLSVGGLEGSPGEGVWRSGATPT